MAFNLEDYEDVATLNKWFIANYPMGRSDISVISHDAEKGYILVQATLWRDATDPSPAVSNIAFGSRETYIPNMKKFYVEDTATSSLGRAIILLLKIPNFHLNIVFICKCKGIILLFQSMDFEPKQMCQEYNGIPSMVQYINASILVAFRCLQYKQFVLQ